MSEVRERVESFNKGVPGVKTMPQIREMLNNEEYDFLRDDPHLGEHVAILGLGGSYAYGMAKEGSDVDIRGIALNSKEEILRGTDFEQVVNTETDTTIYSLKKMVNLLLSNNPNTLEILGLGLDQYIYANFSILKELKELEEAFLSRRVIYTFGGYSLQQFRRLQSKVARDLGEEQMENHILDTIGHAEEDFKTRFPNIQGSFKLYVDKAVTEGHTDEIFIDTKADHIPFREYSKYINEYHGIVRGYDKGDSKRNKHAASHDKISKHMTHLMRLYYMCFDILEYHKVITYRKDEHDLLMKIRLDGFIGEDKQPIPEFFKMVDEAEDKLKRLAKETTLPEEPDYERVYKWLESVNERIILGEL